MTADATPIGRRRLLVGLAAVTVTGCSPVDPAVTGGPTRPPLVPATTAPPPRAGSLPAAALETALAEQSSTLLARQGLTPGLRDRLELVAAGHRVHALALSGPQPTLRPTSRPTATPPPDPPDPTRLPTLAGDRARAVAALGDQIDAAATGYATTAWHTTGSTALLWGSLAVSARMAADAITRADPVTTPSAEPPAALPQVTDVAAAQQLLAQLHAIVWGYRTALAALGGGARDRAAADLGVRMRSRDALVAWLAGRSARMPAAEPAYGVPVEPTSASRAGSLIMIMETDLLPFAGQWLAGCDDGSRRSALDGLTASGLSSVYWGGPPRTWPGWPD